MSNSCPKFIRLIFSFLLFFSFFLTIDQDTAYAVACGNGVCQASQGEDCSTCPADCGVCPTPTPTNTPTPTPTSTPTPVPTSTPTPTNVPTPTPTPTVVPGQPTSTPTPTPTSGPTPTPTNTPTPTPTPVPTPTPTVSPIFPLVALNPFSQNPTNNPKLTFIGRAFIGQGTISSVEYSLNGSSWNEAKPTDKSFDSKDEKFSFTTSSLSNGTYTVKVRAKSNTGIVTQQTNYATETITVAATPPKVILENISTEPIANQTPTISGTVQVSQFAEIESIQISIDGGLTWNVIENKDKQFITILKKLEDGNYTIQVKAIDTAGNVGVSEKYLLIIDTIPPIIGSVILAIGPQILTPDANGKIRLVIGAPVTFIVSMKGGVISATLSTSDNTSYPLTSIAGTYLWKAEITPQQVGDEAITITASDGANNITNRQFQFLTVENSEVVYDSRTNKAIGNTQISVYDYDVSSKSWVLWDADAYGQKNPFITSGDGKYSFIIPPGQYYVEAKAKGYITLQTESFSLSKTSLIALSLPLEKDYYPFIPFFPSIPQTLPYSPLTKETRTTASKISTLAFINIPTLAFVDQSLIKGKKVALTFLTLWSQQSSEQALFLSNASAKLPKDQEVFVVFLQESKGPSEIFVKRGGYTFPFAVDENGTSSKDFNIFFTPTTFFVDSNHKVVEVFVGVLTQEEILEKLSALP